MARKTTMPPDSIEPASDTKPPLRWGRVLLLAILCVILIVAGGVTWILNDTQRVKEVVEKVVTNLTDRPFHIHGDFDFSLGSEISVTASKIEWTNAAWSSQPTMLTIESAAVSVDVISLLRPPVIITRAVASNARLDFEWGPDNESNWLLIKSDKPHKDKESRNPLPLLLDAADLSNVDLYFRHPGLTEELLIQIEHATQKQDDKNRLVLDINALVDNRKIGVDGRIGPFPELIVAGAVDFRFHATGPNASVNVEGDFGDLASLKDPDLKFELAAPEISPLLDIFNLPAVTSGKLSLQGSVVSSDDKIDGTLKGVIGEFDIDATADTASLQTLQGLSANILSQGPSAATAGNAVGIKGLPGEPYELKIILTDTSSGLQIDELDFATADATVTASGVISDFPKFTDIDLTLKANVPDISRFKGLLPDGAIPPLSLALDGSISSDAQGDKDSVTANVRLGPNAMVVNGWLTQDPQFIGSDFKITATLPNLLEVGKVTGIPFQRAETLTAKGTLTVIEKGIRLQKFNGKIGQDKFDLGGDINFIDTPFSAALDVDASGSNLAEAVSLLAATDRIPALPYQLAGKLAFAGNKLDLGQIRGTLGPNSISADGSVILIPGTPDIDLDIAAKGPNLQAALKGQGIDDIPAQPFDLKTSFRLDGTGVHLSKLNFLVANDKLLGSVSSGWPDNPGKLEFDLVATGKDLRAALPAIPGYLPAAVSFDAIAKGDLNDDYFHFERLNLTLGTAKIDLSGKLDRPPSLRAKGVKLQAKGEQLRHLGTFADWQLPDVPFSVSATMGGTENSINVEDFLATAGKNNLRGKFTIDNTDKLNIGLDVTSTYIDIQAFRAAVEDELAKDNSSRSSDAPPDKESKRDKKDRLIPDLKLPLEFLNSFDASITASIDEFVGQRLYVKKLSIEGSVQSGTLNIERLKATTNKNATLEAKLSLTPNSKGTKAEATATATAKNLIVTFGKLDAMMRNDNPGQDVDLYLTGEGATLRDLAATLNGYLWLQGGERQIAASQLSLLAGDFLTQVLSTINPFVKKDPYQILECDRVFFEATDGILQTSPAILLRTNKINMQSVGAVNLKTEKIDFSVQTSPLKGIGISASDLVNPFIKIGGTLSSPALVPNATGTLIEGGAAVVTMGASLVAKSMYKRWLGPRDPCKSLIEEAREIRKKRDPTHVPAD